MTNEWFERAWGSCWFAQRRGMGAHSAAAAVCQQSGQRQHELKAGRCRRALLLLCLALTQLFVAV